MISQIVAPTDSNDTVVIEKAQISQIPAILRVSNEFAISNNEQVADSRRVLASLPSREEM